MVHRGGEAAPAQADPPGQTDSGGISAALAPNQRPPHQEGGRGQSSEEAAGEWRCAAALGAWSPALLPVVSDPLLSPQMLKKMEQMKKKAEAVVSTVDISEREKVAQLRR